MDKKSIIFIFTMVISFFLINQWYSEKNQEKLLKNIQNEASFSTSSSEQIKIVDVDASEIPITSYSSLDNKNLKLGYGILSDKSFITIKNKDVLKQIDVSKAANSVAMDLIFQSDDGFCYYSSSPDVQLETAFLPQFKQLPVVLVPLVNQEKKYITGTYQNQKISLSAPTKEDSIVFTKAGKGYLPIGIYLSKTKKFQLLTEFTLLRDFLTFRSTDYIEAKDQEQFYVLENDCQQVVFSNFGGAIAEINLPFKNDQNASIVLPLETDKLLSKKFPYESSFPIVSAVTVNSIGRTIPYTSKIGGYYPLLRRDLIERNGKKSQDIQSRFYATNLISNGKPITNQPYRLKRMEKDLIEFESFDGKRRITKTYRLPKEGKAPYALLLTVKIDGDASGIYLSSGVPEVELIGGSPDSLLQYALKKNDKFVVEKIKLPKATVVNTEEKISYVANSNGYFGLMLSSLQNSVQGYAASFIPGNLAPTRLSVIDTDHDRFTDSKYPGYEVMLPLDPNQKVYQYALYAGPIEADVLADADAGIASSFSNPGFASAQTYYGFFSFISEPFAKFLFLLMKLFYAITSSWGISIILLTVALRVMLFPLNNWASKSNVKMQEIAPKLKAIQEKFQKDPQRMQNETLKFYRENKINPFSGFLPLLVQIPFMIGMFDLLKSSFQLRGAAFIPGWINNLSAPDTIISWSYPIPFIGNSLHLLPILVAAVMLWQQKINMPKVKAGEMTDQQRQQQAIGTFFTIACPLLFYHVASGLNLYWLFSTLLAVAQQVWTKRKIEEKKGS